VFGGAQVRSTIEASGFNVIDDSGAVLARLGLWRGNPELVIGDQENGSAIRLAVEKGRSSIETRHDGKPKSRLSSTEHDSEIVLFGQGKSLIRIRVAKENALLTFEDAEAKVVLRCGLDGNGLSHLRMEDSTCTNSVSFSLQNGEPSIEVCKNETVVWQVPVPEVRKPD
jgi:hypothetical protein